MNLSYGYRHISGSIALRVLLVCFILLVIPLFFHSLLMYRQEYQTKKRDLFLQLEGMTEEKNRLISTWITLQKKNLQILSSFHPPSQFLDRWARQEEAISLCYVEETPSKKEFTIITVPSGAQQVQLTYSGLQLSLSARNWLATLSVDTTFPYLAGMAILDEKQQLVLSTNPELKIENLQILSKNATPASSAAKKDFFGSAQPLYGTAYSLLTFVSEKTLLNLQKREVFTKLSSLFFFILAIGGIGALALTIRMARPLKQLYRTMDAVKEGELSTAYIQDPLGFEINILGQNFNAMIQSLVKHMQEAEDARVNQELLINELKIGHEIQKTIFPKELPEFPGIEIGVGFEPAEQVAGDFYDLFASRGKLILSIADAAGKGISACLYSLLVRSLLRSSAAFDDNLATFVCKTNQLFCLDTGDSGMFVTAWIGIFDPTDRSLAFSSCGHFPALLKKREKKPIELKTKGIALGVIPFDSLETDRLQLELGDLLLLYTDGILEAQNPAGQFFGASKLVDLLDQTEGKSAQEVVDTIVKELKHFTQQQFLFDDATLLAIRLI